MATVKRADPLSHNVRQRLLRNKLRRANQRTHRPCATCETLPIVCSQCARLWCLTCHPDDCPWPHMTPPSVQTQVPAVGHSNLKRRESDVVGITKFPPAFKDFIHQIRDNGGEVKSLIRRQSDRSLWDVIVFIPTNSMIATPKLGEVWFGHTTRKGVVPNHTQGGMDIHTTLNKENLNG
jgi:hypothetical protein